MDPQFCFSKEVIVDEVVLMAMTVNEDSNGIGGICGLKDVLIAGCVDESPLGIINEKGMTMGVFSATNELERPSFKIKHSGFPGIPSLFMYHQVSGPGIECHRPRKIAIFYL
jgi:hypothetical protein